MIQLKYLIFLVFLTSCQVRWTLETPWTTQPGIYWNKVSNVEYITYFECRENYVRAEYPGFDTNFTITNGKVKMWIDRQFYEKPCTIITKDKTTIAMMSDKEFVRIDLGSGITTLKFKGMYRVYLKDHI